MSEYEIGLYRIIGEMMRDIRTSRGLTLEQIAEKLGVIPKTLQRYETGERKIKISTIIELSRILSFDYDTFMAEAKLCFGWLFEMMMWLFLTLPMLIIKIFKPRKYKSKTVHKTMCVCQACGHSWTA